MSISNIRSFPYKLYPCAVSELSIFILVPFNSEFSLSETLNCMFARVWELVPPAHSPDRSTQSNAIYLSVFSSESTLDESSKIYNLNNF